MKKFLIQATIFLFFLIPVNYLLSENLKQKNIFPKESIDLYSKYVTYIHHMRPFEDYLDIHRFPMRVAYTEYVDGNNLSTEFPLVLLQGDSWFNFDLIHPVAPERLKKMSGQKKIKVISGGTPSYSPTLMLKQFEIFSTELGIKPRVVIAHIDQTDLGDEICRYKRRFFSNKLLWGVSPEPFESRDPFNVLFFLDQQKILNSEDLAIFKYTKMAYSRLKRYSPLNLDDSGGCRFDKILSYLENQDTNAQNYFIERMSSYIKGVLADGSVKHLQLTTSNHRRHNHADHFGGKYSVNIATLVDTAIGTLSVEERSRVSHRHYVALDDSLFKADDPASHFEADAYPEFIEFLFDGLDTKIR